VLALGECCLFGLRVSARENDEGATRQRDG
jgi:hypothetical protein